MKQIAAFLMILALLPACAPPAQPTEVPGTDAPSTQPAEGPGALDDMLIGRLSENLGLDMSEIAVKSEKEAEFKTTCFDITLPDTSCAEGITPGRIIILEAKGIEYEYRTNAAGDSIQPATLALTWTREGGIAGFCDRLTVFLSGEVYASNCRSQPNEISGTFAGLLTDKEQNQFTALYLKFDETSLDVSDPLGVSDRMTNTLEFYGKGTGKPAKADQQALFDWALELFQKLNA